MMLIQIHNASDFAGVKPLKLKSIIIIFFKILIKKFILAIVYLNHLILNS